MRCEQNFIHATAQSQTVRWEPGFTLAPVGDRDEMGSIGLDVLANSVFVLFSDHVSGRFVYSSKVEVIFGQNHFSSVTNIGRREN